MSDDKKLRLAITDFWNCPRIFERYYILKYLKSRSDIIFVPASEEHDLLVCSVFGSTKAQYQSKKLFITYENKPRWEKINHHSMIVSDTDWCISCNKDFRPSQCRFLWSTSGSSDYHPDIETGILDKSSLRSSKKHITKPQFCSFVYGNSSLDPGVRMRINLMKRLTTDYAKVDSAGGCENNMPNNWKLDYDDEAEFYSSHKFNIAFENSYGPGYISEKLIRPYIFQTVPIYWGDKSTVEEYFNMKSMIYHDISPSDVVYQSIAEKAMMETMNKIQMIDQNDVLYDEMLSTKPFDKLPDFLSRKVALKFVDSVIAELK